jgi:hypothetical protein
VAARIAPKTATMTRLPASAAKVTAPWCPWSRKRELDHADDHDDQLQPHVVADRTAGLQLPDQDEYEYR